MLFYRDLFTALPPLAYFLGPITDALTEASADNALGRLDSRRISDDLAHFWVADHRVRLSKSCEDL